VGQTHHGSNRTGRADTGLHLHATCALPRGTEEQLVLLLHARVVGWALGTDAHRPVLRHHLFLRFRGHLLHLFSRFHEFVHSG